jgi:hypothetical protein
VQRLSALVRYIFTVILVPITIAVATHFIEEQPRETSNAVLKFLFDLSEQTWFRVTASLLVGFVAGLWVQWFLQKLDRSRAEERSRAAHLIFIEQPASWWDYLDDQGETRLRIFLKVTNQSNTDAVIVSRIQVRLAGWKFRFSKNPWQDCMGAEIGDNP